MRVYADAAAYVGYTGGEAPNTVDTLLRIASKTVDTLLLGRVYDTDTAGLPTDPDHVQALSDAACAIAQECDTLGTLTPGGTQRWETVGIGSVSLSGRGTAEGATFVDGIPVPAVAVVLLSDVGVVQVWSC